MPTFTAELTSDDIRDCIALRYKTTRHNVTLYREEDGTVAKVRLPALATKVYDGEFGGQEIDANPGEELNR